MFFWVVFLIAFPYAIYQFENRFNIEFLAFPAFPYFGACLFFLFSSLNVWAGYSMSQYGSGTPLPLDCANKLVVRGPYQFVRNPMAVGGIGQGVSIGIFCGSLFVVLYALTGALIWHLFVRPKEEVDLTNRFGEAYLVYKGTLRNWIPNLKRKHF